jgi:hypothetical protein
MRKTSFYYSNKLNYRKIYQGGEKKVMRKSLSMLLAIAMIFSMFSSLAFAADPTTTATTELTAQQKYDVLKAKGIFAGMTDGSAGLDQPMNRAQFARVAALILGLDGIGEPDTKKVTVKPFTDVELGLWYTEEVAAVKEASLFVGNGNGTFTPVANITVQQLAVVVAGLLGLEKVEGAKVAGAADWAAGYVQAIINAKISFPTNYKENAIRSDLASLAYSAYLFVEAAKVTTATKVVSVTATNLKEVTVLFDGELNEKSAENLASYTLKDENGTVQALKAAELQADKKSVLITVNTFLGNQEVHKLSVNGVKGSDTAKAAVNATDVAFTPVDAALPTVEKVEGLGNKAIKVTFSEPVNSISTVADTFKVDDTVVSGILSGSGTRTLIVELFSPLAVGEHTLAINNKIKDFASYDLIAISQKFTVVEDKAAPTVTEVKDVTLEGATVVFSEDVKDTEALKGSNYYWMNGTTKHTADGSVTRIDGKTFKLTFSGSAKLPAVATDLYIINIVDYSGNVIADNWKISINPIVDQTRPEVVSAIYNDASQVKLTFNKAIDLTTFKASNVVVKDSAGKVVSKGVTVAEGYSASSQTVTLNFTGTFDAGTYTIEVSGLKDNTTLANSMLPYTITIGAKDQTAPNVTGVNGTKNVYYITFDKAMDVSTTASILNPDSYYLTSYVQNATNKAGKLPTGTNIVPVNGNKGVILTLPSSVTSVGSITIQGVKSASGVVLAGYVQTPAITNTFIAKYAYATDKESVMVKFNQPVSSLANIIGIQVDSTQVTGATIDSNDSTLVKLTLSSANYLATTDAGETVVIPTTAFNNLNGTGLTTAFSSTVGDAIAPSVKKTATGGKIAIGSDITQAANVVTINFDEAISVTNSAKYIENFSAYKADGSALTYGSDFSVSSTTATTIVLTFSATLDGVVKIAINNANGNIVDAAAVKTSDGTSETSLDAVGFDTRDASTVTGDILMVDIPTITSITYGNYDQSSGVLVLTVVGASEVGDTINVAKLTFKDASSTLNGASASYALTNSTGVVTSATAITVTLSAADKAAVNQATGTVTLDSAAGFIVDAAGNVSALATVTGTAITVTP